MLELWKEFLADAKDAQNIYIGSSLIVVGMVAVLVSFVGMMEPGAQGLFWTLSWIFRASATLAVVAIPFILGAWFLDRD